MNKLLLVDGNSILNRAFYGLPDLTTSEGLHTNAVLGFLNIVLKVLEEEKATHLCVAFDVKQKTFRHEMFEEYKGTRKSMPDELREQVPLIKDILTKMNITICEKDGYEADDILGTLSRVANKEGYKVTVLSGDRDLLQLATEDILIRIPKTKAGKTTIEDYYAKDVEELYGVTPLVFIDMKGLMGDSSDNIPGVPGIGEKTASKLLIEYGSMEGLYDNIDSLKKSKMKENLINYKEQAFMSKILATIKLDCVLDVDLSNSTVDNMFNQQVFDEFTRLELKSLLNRFKDNMKTSKTLEYTKELVDDFDRVNEIFKEAEKNNTCGVAYICDKEGEPLGAAICYDKTNVKVIRFMNFITLEFFNSKLLELNKNTTLSFVDIKSILPIVDLSDDDNIFDCSLAAYLINPLVESYAYDELSKIYLNVSLQPEKDYIKKQDINLFSFEDNNLLELFALKALIPFITKEILIHKLNEFNLLDLYNNIEIPCLFALYDMEQNGIKVDKEALRSFGDKLKLKIDELTKKIYELAGQEFNINSTKQLGVILFEQLGLTCSKKTKSGYSTNVEVLEKIKDEHEIIPCLLEYRQLTKLNSTYVEGLVPYISSDSRIHGKFNQTVTATGRISSTEPNLQNIPTRLPLGREIRKVFIPEKDFLFIGADYSQIELRVLAHLSNDKALLDAYNNNHDIHAATASEVFDVPIDQVDSLMRRKAKAVNFGIVYGISSFGLGQDLDISRKEAESYIAKYFETYKDVKVFLDKTVESVKEKGYSVTLFNRIRPIPELKSSNFMQRSFGERAAMNSPIQGTAADIIKIAMINVNKELKLRNLRSKLVLQIHDELLIETHKDEFDEVKEILTTKMSEAVKLNVPLIVDVNFGNNWYEAK